MQATQSASESRNRSLLMTLIMIVGALSPVLATAADDTGGQGNNNTTSPPTLDCEGDFADYNESVWFVCAPGNQSYHLQWSLEDRRFVDMYGAYGDPVPNNMQEIASGEAMDSDNASYPECFNTWDNWRNIDICSYSADMGHDSTNAELRWKTHRIDNNGNDIESTRQEGMKNMHINHGEPTVEIMSFQDNENNWNLSFMPNYLPSGTDPSLAPEDYNLRVWVFNPEDIRAGLFPEGDIDFEDQTEQDESLVVDEFTNSSTYDMWYLDLPEQPWVAYAVLGNATGVLAWNVATGGIDHHHGPGNDDYDNNRYGDATLEVILNDLPTTCDNGWFKVGLIEMKLNEWGHVDRHWVYEQEVHLAQDMIFDDAPNGRYGVEVEAHCDENSNRAEYRGAYDWAYKWDWENESTVELKDNETKTITVDMYKTGMHGDTNINLTANLPLGYAFSTMERIHWSHEKECAWFDDWDNGMNETGMFWCSWEGTPSKENNQSTWWYWCRADENNKGYHCTDDLGMANSADEQPAMPPQNRCNWAVLDLNDKWVEDRHEMEMSRVTGFGWGMDYSDSSNTNSITGEFGHAIVGEWVYIVRVGCHDSDDQWFEFTQRGNLTIVDTGPNDFTFDFTEDDIWRWEDEHHHHDEHEDKPVDLEDFMPNEGVPSHVGAVYDGWGVELNMEMEISSVIRGAIDNQLNGDGFLDEYEVEYELWNIVNFDDFSYHADGEWKSTYMCSDGSEIPGEYVNDRFEDCDDGSDEGDAVDESNWREEYVSDDRDQVTVVYGDLGTSSETYYSYGMWMDYDIRDFYGPVDKGPIWVSQYQRFEPDMMNTMATTSDMGPNEWKEPEPGSTVSFNWEDIEVESDIKLDIVGYGGWAPSGASFDTVWSEPSPCDNEEPSLAGILAAGSTDVTIEYVYRGHDHYHDDGPPWHTSEEDVWLHIEFDDGTLVAAGGSVRETGLRQFVDACFGNEDGMVTQNEVDDFAEEYGWMFETRENTDYNDNYNAFECKDGMTIPWEWVGDGYDDCANGEDERYEELEQEREPEKMFKCKDGTDIKFREVNNGRLDCTDGSDETMEDATGETINTFTCRDGTVIKFHLVNNGFDDCEGGEDEKRKTGEDDPECYTEGEMDTDCDGFPDSRDECPRTPGIDQGCQGEGASFVCHSEKGNPNSEEQTIPWYKVNNGEEDCGDGSDEPQDDDGDGETDNWHTCGDGEQVIMDYVNDGFQDCEDGSDEGVKRNDGEPPMRDDDMGPKWTCPDGKDIPFENLNDGIRDCENGADEPVDIDGDGMADNRFRCGDEDDSNVTMDRVNDGVEDCPNGHDEGKQERQMDSDGDGIDDSQDHCPYEEGVATNGGCPPEDRKDDENMHNHDNDSSTTSGHQADPATGDGDSNDHKGHDHNEEGHGDYEMTQEDCERRGGEWHSGELGEDGEVYEDHCHFDDEADDFCPWNDPNSPCHKPECDEDDISPECQRTINEYCEDKKDDSACIFLTDERCRGAANDDGEPSRECADMMMEICEGAPASDMMCMMFMQGGDGDSDSCMDVKQGDIAPADGYFSPHSSRDSTNEPEVFFVEAGEIAPEDGVFCLANDEDHPMHHGPAMTPCGPAWMVMAPPKPGQQGDPEIVFMDCVDQYRYIFTEDSDGNEVTGPMALLGPVLIPVYQADSQVWVADYVRHLVEFGNTEAGVPTDLLLIIPTGDGPGDSDSTEEFDVYITSEGVNVDFMVASTGDENGDGDLMSSRPATGDFIAKASSNTETAILFMTFDSEEQLLRPEERPDQYETWKIEEDGKVDMDGDNAPDGQICYDAAGTPLGFTTKRETTIEEVSGITVKTETWNCGPEWITELARTDFLPTDDTTTDTSPGSVPACSLKVADQGIDQLLPATTASVGPFFVPEMIDIPFSVVCTPTDGSLDSAQVVVDGGEPFSQQNIASFEASGLVKGMNASQSKTVVITWTDGQLTATYTVSFTGNASEAVATNVASTDADAGFVPGFPVALTVAAFLGAILVSSRRDEDEEA